MGSGIGFNYEKGITLKRQEEIETPESLSWGDIFRLFNPMGAFIQDPNDFLDNGPEVGFDATNVEGFNELSMDEMDWVIDSTSTENYMDRLSRAKKHKESMERFAQDDSYSKYGMALIAGTLDPTILVPVGGAVGKIASAVKATSTLGRMTAVGAGSGTVGALSNVASEYLMDVQGNPTDYTSAALWGFALGGTLGGVVEGASRTAYKTKLAQAFLRDDIEAGIKLDNQLLKPYKYSADNQPVLTEFIDPKSGKSTSISRGSALWMASDIHKIWSSPIAAIQKFARGADVPSVSTGSTIGTTARDYSKILDGSVHKAQMDLYMGYRDARADKSFKGSADDYFVQKGKEYHKLAAEQEIKVYKDPELKRITDEYQKELRNAKKLEGNEKKIAELEAKYTELKNNLWAKHKPKIPKHLEPIEQYFIKMLNEGKEVGVKELSDITPDRIYMPRQLDFAKIGKMDAVELENIIFIGLAAHPSNISEKISEQDLREAANVLASNWKTKGIDSTSFNDPLYTGKTYLENKKTYGARRLKIDNNEILDILESHLPDVMGGYHYFTRGQIAIRKAYPELRNTYSNKIKGKEAESIEEVFKTQFVEPIQKEAIAKNMPGELYLPEIEAMSNVFKDLLGQQRIFKETYKGQQRFYNGARVAAQANSAMLSGWFGINQALEIPSALWATGFNRIFHKQFIGFMKDTVKALFTDGKPNNEFMQELLRTGYLSSLLEQSGINRMADTTTVFNMGKIENKLHKLNNQLYKFNGMRAMTSFMEAMVASNVVTLIRKGQRLDILQKFGLSKRDITAINKELDRVGDITPDGTINKLGLEEMEPTVRERLQVVMSRAIEEGVIQGDTMKLPSWMITPGPFKQLVMQFMRFPIAANEILLRKGFTESQAGMAASVAGAYMMSIGIRYLEEQARIGLGITAPGDAKYDITTKEGFYNATIKSTNYISAFGGLLLPYQYMAAFAQKGMFGEYVGDNVLAATMGVTASRVQIASDMLKMILDGKTDSTRFWKSAQTFSPLYNLPIYKDAVSELIEKNTLDY